MQLVLQGTLNQMQNLQSNHLKQMLVISMHKKNTNCNSDKDSSVLLAVPSLSTSVVVPLLWKVLSMLQVDCTETISIEARSHFRAKQKAATCLLQLQFCTT